MMVWSLFIIDLMGLFFYTKISSIISIGDLPTTNIIEPVYSMMRENQIDSLFCYIQIYEYASLKNSKVSKNRDLIFNARDFPNRYFPRICI